MYSVEFTTIDQARVRIFLHDFLPKLAVPCLISARGDCKVKRVEGGCNGCQDAELDETLFGDMVITRQEEPVPDENRFENDGRHSSGVVIATGEVDYRMRHTMTADGRGTVVMERKKPPKTRRRRGGRIIDPVL
ncbi:MAG: hypothetical protein WCV93_05585 [Candidatus Shapirobacteria bacterium]|jgi:hypothetical protein